MKAGLYILLSVVGLFYSISTFILSIMSYNSLGKTPLALEGLIKNWENYAISDIIAVDPKEGGCPSDYEAMI